MERNLGHHNLTHLRAPPRLEPTDIIIGKDLLELLTTGMQTDPLAIYREYVQNAVDAVDEARRCGIMAPSKPGRVQIDFELASRSVRIRDNGVGLAWSDFAQRLTSIGASTKRSSPQRGFRGIGRLVGLGYAQEVIFRSSVEGEEAVSDLRWDSRLLRKALRGGSSSGTLTELIRTAVRASRVKLRGYPKRFFEVELRGMIRLGDDRLLNPSAIADYLSQVAPLPFAPEFRFGGPIGEALSGIVPMGDLELHVGATDRPIHRPHRNTFRLDGRRLGRFHELEMVEVPSVDGNLAAIGWILHHAYEGAVPREALVRGLRLRSGNIQVGGPTLLEELFPEPRFNAWTVGEIHVIDKRILPNGRRDHFEPGVYFNTLLNHLTPVARGITRRCRTSSRKRHVLRKFVAEESRARESLSILGQGTLRGERRKRVLVAVQQRIASLEKLIRADLVKTEMAELEAKLAALRSDLRQLTEGALPSSPLDHLSPAKRKMYQHLFGLIYECSTNRIAAKALIDRILVKLEEDS